MSLYLYIALSGEHAISTFTLDPDSGRLTFQEKTGLDGGPGPLCVDPAQNFLYAGLRSSRQIASLRIDRATGALSLLRTISLEADPCYLSTDRKGRFLLSAYFGAGRIAVHRIAPDGTAEDPPVEWRATRPRAHCIQTDPSNRFVFVPHIADSNAILQFLFDEEEGRIFPNPVPFVEPEEPIGPRHFVFHPRGDLLYCANEQGSSVTAYRLDLSSGTLEPFQTISTLPPDFQGENTCAQIHITPSGRFLYASNRGHDSIAGFSIRQATGELTPTGQFPTEAMPRAFGIDPAGGFLFAAGLTGGKLALYRIDSGSGILLPTGSLYVGERPMWVLPLDLGGRKE